MNIVKTISKLDTKSYNYKKKGFWSYNKATLSANLAQNN